MRGKRFTALVLSALLLASCAPGGTSSAPAGSAGSSSGGSSASSSTPPAASGQPTAPSSRVQVDWSRLEGADTPLQPDLDGGRWFPDYTGRLITGENYGPLIPYVGAQAYPFNRWEYEGETQEYWSFWATNFYGLMTREGKIVTDPVYQYAFPYSYMRNGTTYALPVLLLSQADPRWEGFNSGQRYAVAAEDGSWCTEFEFLNYTNREEKLFLLRPEGCTVLDSKTGARRDWSWTELEVSAEELPDTLDFIQWGIGLNWLDQGICLGRRDDQAAEFTDMTLRILNPDTGEVSWVDYKQWDRWHSEYFDRRWTKYENFIQEGGQMAVVLDGRSYPLKGAPEECYLSRRQGDFAILASGEQGELLYRLSTGERLMEARNFDLISDLNRPGTVLPAAYAEGSWTVYSEQMEPLLTLPHTSPDEWMYFSLQDGLLSLKSDFSLFGCYDLARREYIFYRNLGLGD